MERMHQVNEILKNADAKNPMSDFRLFWERFEWAARIHIPHNVGRVLPRSVVSSLRELKMRILKRSLARHREFEQSMEDALASASVSIVVPIHDAPKVVGRCLASLEKYAPKAEVILVDDGSTLVETDTVIRDFVDRNRWKSVRHDTPCGHSMACGAGASLATRQYLCLLNSDTVVTPWCWRLVTKAFEQDQEIAVAGPSTSQSGTVQTLLLAKYLSFHWSDNQICDFAKHLVAECPDPVVTDLPWASGFALFIRRNLWEQLAGFDRNLPDYGNEVELCRRVAAKGYRTVWVRNSYIHHFGQQSYGETIGEDAIRARIVAAEIYNKQEQDSSSR